IHVDTDRTKAGLVGVSVREAAQATLESVLGNINTPSVWIDGANGQSYYVVTQYDGARVVDPNALAQIPVKGGASADPVTLGSYGRVWRSVGPIAVERDQLERASHVEMQTERRDIGSAALALEEKLKGDPRTKNVRAKWVGQVALMQTTFGGLGL